MCRVSQFELAHPTCEGTLRGIRKLVAEVVADLQANGEAVPQPYALRSYSGKLVLRVPPEVHRELVLEAAEAGVSLNHLASSKLSR